MTKRFFLRLVWYAAAALTLAGWGAAAWATDEYARATGKGCIFCHQESTGGQLRTAGFAYIRNGYRYPISQAVLQKAEALQQPLHKSLRFALGYLHLLAGVIFFGAIFYIHIFVRPGRLTGGLPKPERILGLSCMALLTVTGAYLTWARMDRWEQFWDNTFGMMLTLKIGLFALMAAIGLAAVTVVHRRMRAAAQQPPADPGDGLTPARLAAGDGSDGRPALIAYEGKIYDVSASGRWKSGRHFGRHQAGTDLTAAMAGAPHGPEVLEKVACLGALAAEDPPGPAGADRVRRVFVVMAYTNLVLIFLILACIGVWRWDFPLRLMPEARAEIVAGQTCVACHRQKTPAIVADWQDSAHGRLGVDCYKCHRANNEALILKSHLEHTKSPVSPVVSPIHCAGCHPKEAEQFARSKHANTYEIMWRIDHWLKDGMNNAIERATGCLACHGTEVQLVDGRPVANTWPNVGIGRLNPDGSKGSCSSCHTRHRFSIEEARKPEACDQCHLGPDHPQIEIYTESKHGTLYHAEGYRWQFDPKDRRWTAGRDFRAPTCAVCHMSAAGEVPATHDVTERLAWETQAPFTVRPSEFEPFPAATDWQTERAKMTAVCRQCHAESWARAHFDNFDAAVAHYNETYYRPARARMDDLYAAGLLSAERQFDEPLEWEFYELWHHEGRRARMGAAMMAPDYAWWHGFYELKHRFNHVLDAARDLEAGGKPSPRWENFPGRFDPPL